MDDVQMISSDEDDSCPGRPCSTPGWFLPNLMQGVNKSSLAARSCDNTLVQNNRGNVNNDLILSNSESRKRVRPSDQGSSSVSRKRPHFSSSTDSEPEAYSNVQQGNQNFMSNSGFSVISEADPDGPILTDRQRKNFYPEPGRHSPFHFFVKNSNTCRSSGRGFDLPAVFKAASPVFHTRYKPALPSEPVEILSSDDSDDSFIWTSSQMVAPPRNFCEIKNSDTVEVELSDDENEIVASQRIVKKHCTRLIDPFSERTIIGRDFDNHDHVLTSSLVRSCSADTESESLISKKVPKMQHLNSENSDFQKSSDADFQQIRDPMAGQDVSLPQRGMHSLFKIPVIVADCDSESHVSCQSYTLNIAPLSSRAATTGGSCVHIPSLRPSSSVQTDCEVVLKDRINHPASDIHGEVKSSCNTSNLMDKKWQASETEVNNALRPIRQPVNDQKPPDVTLGNQDRNWSVSWDQSNSGSESVLGNAVANRNPCHTLSIPVTLNLPMTGHQSAAADKSGLNITVQRLSAQIDRSRRMSGSDGFFSDDDLFDEFAVTQCDEAVARALQMDSSDDSKKPFDIMPKNGPTTMPQNQLNAELNHQKEFSSNTAETIKSEMPSADLYSQQDNCIIVSDSDDEIFANLTQACMNPMVKHGSDDETDDGWNDDDDDIDSTLLQLDESCFAVPQDEHDSRVESKAEIQLEEDMDCGTKSVYCEEQGLRQLNSGVKVEDVDSYEEVEPETEQSDCKPYGHQLSIIKDVVVRKSRDCNFPVISAGQDAVVPYFRDSRAAQFAFKRDPEIAEICNRTPMDMQTVAEQDSDAEDDVPVGELIEKHLTRQNNGLGLKSKEYTEVKPLPIRMHSAPSNATRKQFDYGEGDEADEDNTILPKFDVSRSRLLLPKEINIKAPQEILEVEVDEPVPVFVQTHSHNACESRDIGMTKVAEYLNEMESDLEDEESFHVYLKDNTPKVTNVNYLEGDELEKSELVLQYYNFSKDDRWLSKTSPVKPKIHSPIASLRKRRPVKKPKKQTKLRIVPGKRAERSASEDQVHKIAQLRESHTLLKKKMLKPSLENRSSEVGFKIERSIRNAKNVMKERAKLVETERKMEITGGESSGLEKRAGKVGKRRKTSPAFSSLEKISSLSLKPTVSGKMQGSTEETSASRKHVSVLDAILGPAEVDRLSPGIKKIDVTKSETVTAVASAHGKSSRKHSSVTAKISENSGGKCLDVFKHPMDRDNALSHKKNTSFKIPRISGQVTGINAAETSALNTSVIESVSSRDLMCTTSIASETLGSVSNCAFFASKESKAETTANRSNSMKTKHKDIVSTKVMLNLERSGVDVEVKKTLADAPKPAEIPKELPWSVTSKLSASKSATPNTSEALSSISKSFKSVPGSSGRVLPCGKVAPSKSSSVSSKSSKSNTSKSATYVTSKLSLPDTSKSSVSSVSLTSNLSSKTQKSLNVPHSSSSTSKLDKPLKMKPSSASPLKPGKLGTMRTDGKMSTSTSNWKSSKSSSGSHKYRKDLDKHRLKNDAVRSTKSDDAAAVQKSRSEDLRTVELVNDQRASVSVDVEKASMLGIGELADNLVAAKGLTAVSVLLDKQGTVCDDTTVADVGGQTSDVQQGQLLSKSNKHFEQQPDITKKQSEDLSKTRDRLAYNQRNDREKPIENRPDIAPVTEPIENHIEILNKPTDNCGGSLSEANQSGSRAVSTSLEKLCSPGFLEPTMPKAVVRPLMEQNQKPRGREIVRTTAPAMGRDMDCITLSQIVNDSIRKTGPIQAPMFSEIASKKRALLDVSLSNRSLERESRKLTDLPKAKVDGSSVLPKESLTSAILYWNPVWMKECEAVKMPPPIVNYDKVYPLLDTYDNYMDYANILQPLMLLEVWESMLKEWKGSQRGSNRRPSKVMPTYLEIQKEKNLMFLHCQGVLTQQENATGRYLRESDLVILNLRAMAVPPKGQPPDPSTTVIKPVFGIVNKVNKHFPVKREEFLNPKIVELKRASGDRSLAITYIVQFGYRKHPIDNSEFISVESITSILPTLRQFSGLANLPRSTLAAEILRPSQWEVFHHNLAVGANQLKERFNPSQIDAISKISKAVLDPYFPPKVCLLQGPPGTGKSHTVIGLVEHLLALNSNVHILLCAPSNAGIDELCRRLVARNRLEKPGNRKDISFVRLGATSSIHRDIVPYALQIQAKKKYEQQQANAPTSVVNTLKTLEQKQKEWNTKLEKCLKENNTSEVELARKELKMLEKRKGNISSGFSKPMSAAEEVRMKKEVLMGADVVCTTLNHSGSQHIVDMMHHQDSSKHHFGCIIVDEACQCTEVDCLIPLQYRTSKLVLVGDPEQLPPTVLSKKASDMNYGQSLFERLYNQLKPTPSSNQPSPVFMLQTQYRMHEDICHFSSKHFYYGLLKTDSNTAKKRSQFRSSAFAVFDLQYTHERSDQSSISVSNPEEADFIVQLCGHLAAWMTPKKAVQNIGIITPYQSQRSLITELFRRSCRELEGIEVGTVDGFQGREKDVVIVSCVRANASRNIGFLADHRRMNVSLTRAKYALYVVGHMKTLTSNSDWSALTADANSRRRLVKVANAHQSITQIQLGCNKS